ncbi:MAG: bifunctional riboflavin kinase/FAD synthetase [Deltaproteobacteria bacterium]|nr:bifunctional riboflavin kinase/FAD synthetase [Deltaproteobacteria bacterium]
MLTVYDWADQIPLERPRAVLTVGVFDGIHLGHQYLIKQVIERAKANQAVSLVLTFEPHPLAVISKASAPEVLTTFKHKAEIMEGLGLDIFGCLKFDDSLRNMGAQQFLDSILGAMVKPVEIIVGPDFRFGRNAEGQVGILREWAKAHRAKVIEAELQKGRDVIYSSSHIRGLLKIGLVDAAALILSRPYRLSGRVVAGQARGRHLGFPTANLGQIAQLVPGPGVYAVKARLRGQVFDGMTSVGHNPTFANQYRTVETYLFDFEDDFYNEILDLDFVGHLRGMVKFDGIEGLVRQLKNDEQAARVLLTNLSTGLPVNN